MGCLNKLLDGMIPAFKRLLPIVSFIIPLTILYSLYPYSFELTWKGRTYYLFFIWLVLLETMLGCENLKEEIWEAKSVRKAIFAVIFMAPTFYVVISNFFGFNAFIVESSAKYAHFAEFMPLSIEYLVFTLMFASIILAEYGIKGLSKHVMSFIFLGLIGAIYLIDNMYPYGHFTPLQILVPATAQIASCILDHMGFQVEILEMANATYGLITILKISNPKEGLLTSFAIGWPCAGADSLIIYSVTTLMFLRRNSISLRRGLAYFLIGAVITYIINVLRVVNILLIATSGGDWRRFHDYYGPLYSISWIILYQPIIFVSQILLRKLKVKRAN